MRTHPEDSRLHFASIPAGYPGVKHSAMQGRADATGELIQPPVQNGEARKVVRVAPGAYLARCRRAGEAASGFRGEFWSERSHSVTTSERIGEVNNRPF